MKNDINKIADNFARYLVGDPRIALRNLENIVENPDGSFAGLDVSDLTDREYSELYAELHIEFRKLINNVKNR